MNFFEDLKKELEEKLEDFSTIEHALILEESNDFIYRFQQTDGDSITQLSDNSLNEDYYVLFNEAFSASIESRTSIMRFIIECLT